MFDILCARMVEEQIKTRGITDATLLKAMESVPRHRFVPKNLWARAYDDNPLPIGFNQTISQPYMVAYMLDVLQLKKSDRVLEVGSGSGYVCALLSNFVNDVVGVECIEELADRSSSVLLGLDVKNVTIMVADGTKHLNKGKFNAIIVSAAAQKVPSVLLEQLVIGGRLVIPIESGSAWQDLWIITKNKDSISEKRLCEVRFVPLVGEY